MGQRHLSFERFPGDQKVQPRLRTTGSNSTKAARGGAELPCQRVKDAELERPARSGARSLPAYWAEKCLYFFPGWVMSESPVHSPATEVPALLTHRQVQLVSSCPFSPSSRSAPSKRPQDQFRAVVTSTVLESGRPGSAGLNLKLRSQLPSR